MMQGIGHFTSMKRVRSGLSTEESWRRAYVPTDPTWKELA